MQEALLNSKTNCAAITQSYLDEIEKNKHLNAFVEVFSDQAKERAKSMSAYPIDMKLITNEVLP